VTTGSKPRTAAKSGSSKSKPMTVKLNALASDTDSDKLSSISYKDDEESSDGGSADGDFDITRLPEKEAQQVLNDEVIFFIHILY
jgi:hypothetical protein